MGQRAGSAWRAREDALTSSSLSARMSRALFQDAKKNLWSGYLASMARWKGCAAGRISVIGQARCWRSLQP